MASKFHIRPNGVVGECRATIQKCQYGGKSGLEDHYPTAQEARAAYERKLESQSIPQSAQKKRDWKKNAKRVGGALVFTVIASTIGSITIGNINSAEALDAEIASNEASVSQEEQLPDLDNQKPQEKESNIDFEKIKKQVGDFGNGIKDSASKIDLSELANKLGGSKSSLSSQMKDLLKGIEGGGYESSITVPVDGVVQFQGRNLEPSQQELDQAKATLASLNVAPENSSVKYNRADQFGKGFKSGVVGTMERRDITNGQFANMSDTARAIGGSFIDPYTGQKVDIEKSSKNDTDVDHVVPLKEVMRSGGDRLSQGERESIANDPDNLAIVSSSANRQKGDKDPGKWMPSYSKSHARYAIATINVKSKYNLSVDQMEYTALKAALESN